VYFKHELLYAIKCINLNIGINIQSTKCYTSKRVFFFLVVLHKIDNGNTDMTAGVLVSKLRSAVRE